MNIVELFAGSRSIGRIAQARGHNVFSVDLYPFEGISLVRSVLDVEPHHVPFIPDLVWASPPCTTYSLLAIGHHRPAGKPMSAAAVVADRLVLHTRQLIEHWGSLYVIENPRATLRKQHFMQGLDRRTVWYCRYGDHRSKPTDLWSNFFHTLECPEGWQPRPQCFNNNKHCHHDRQPRNYAKRKELGLTTQGTTGLSNAYERSKLPPELCTEVIQAAERVLSSGVASSHHGRQSLEVTRR